MVMFMKILNLDQTEVFDLNRFSVTNGLINTGFTVDQKSELFLGKKSQKLSEYW